MRISKMSILLTAFLHVFVTHAHSGCCKDSSSSSSSSSSSEVPHLTADYVIVGLGTAGAVLANKLSADKKTSVIGLHRGENLMKDPEIRLSKNAVQVVLSALIGPPFFEKHDTVPQVDADRRRLPWVLALPLGGTSSCNVGAWVRGTDEVYHKWQKIAGPEWSVDRILKIYKDLENYHGTSENPEFRGTDGPIDVRQIPAPTTIAQIFTNAVVTGANVPLIDDYNDPLLPIGASPRFQYSQKGLNGRLRVSSATAFLGKDVMTPDGHGVDGRKLRVLFNSFGLRAIWEGNKAVGVEYLENDQKKVAFAKKGVIVCAGLFSSPFLMHSGVGPKDLLEKHDIPVIFENENVGKGMADQPMLPLIFTSNPADFPVVNINSPFECIAFLPDPLGGDPTKREVRISPITQIPGLTAVLVDLLQPKSRGEIRIRSADPLVPPIVNIGVLSDPADLALFQNALNVYIQNINNALPKPFYELIFPPPAILNDFLLLAEFIKADVFTNESFQSHCRMAKLKDGGVVNSHGRVHGVKHLYVADDSIVPFPMDGATMASAFLIAANIADLLQED